MKNKIITLFSSSSGNCTLVTDGDTNILVDAGVSANRVVKALQAINLDICEIDGILITHEHSDHIKGVASLSTKYNIPVYANTKTFMSTADLYGCIYERNFKQIEAGKPFTVRGMEVYGFSTPHDSADSMGYTFLSDGGYMSVATDTGHISKSMLTNLSKSEIVLIESNHDVKMLKEGRYPYHLKKRILSDSGHLSNDNCAWLATQLAIWGTKRILLGHLSEQNNTPELAYNTAEKMLAENGMVIGRDVLLKVALKSGITEI